MLLCETTAQKQIEVNFCCTLKSVRHWFKNNTSEKLEGTSDRLWSLQSTHTTTMWQQEEAESCTCVCAESNAARYRPGQYCSLCNRRWKENIDCEHGESRVKEGDTRPCWTRGQDKDNGCYLTPPNTNMERSAKATQGHSGPCDLQNQNKLLSRADGPVSWMSHTILSGHRKWNVFMSLCCRLCVWLGASVPATEEWGRDSITQWLNVIH